MSPSAKRVLVVVEVLLGESKVHDVDLFEILTQHEVRRLDVTVDESCIVHLFNCSEHLNQELHCYLETVVRI